MRLSTLLLALLIVCFAQSGQAQTVLDNFEEGAVSLTLPPMAETDFDTAAGLDPSNVLATERFTALGDFFPTTPHGGASVDLVLTGADDALQFNATGPLGQGIEARYDFASPLDTTALGSDFSVDLDTLVDPMGDVSVTVIVGDLLNDSIATLAPSASGTLVFPFSAFVADIQTPADFTQVLAIVLQVTTTDDATSSVSVSLDDFQIVPEPSSSLLASSALLALASLRRKRGVA